MRSFWQSKPTLKMLLPSWTFDTVLDGLRSFNAKNFTSVGQRAAKSQALKVGGLKKKSAIRPRPHSNRSARVRERPGSNQSQSLMAFNPIPRVVWNYVNPCGGAIMARMDSSHPEAVSRHPKAQKWLPSNFFDLWLSIDTKNSTLWATVLAKLAVERPWWKMKIFMQKYVKIKIFLIHESYIHQKKA